MVIVMYSDIYIYIVYSDVVYVLICPIIIVYSDIFCDV